MKAYLQGADGSERTLDITQPDPKDGTYCAHMNEETWVRIVPVAGGTLTASERRGLEGLYAMDLTRVMEMVRDYAGDGEGKKPSILDMSECWEEVRETMDALLVIRRLLDE